MSDEFSGAEPGTEGWEETGLVGTPEGQAGAVRFKPSDSARSEETGLSSVEIGTTAKGEPQVKVKVYAESNSPQAVQMAADNAADLYRSVRGKVRQP